MTPGKLDILILQGATFRRVIRLTSGTTPIDLSGATARMHIRQTIADETPLIELNDGNGRAVITDAAGGEITLMIEDEDTTALDFVAGVYDLEIAYSGGTVDRVLEGKVKLSREVTR